MGLRDSDINTIAKLKEMPRRLFSEKTQEMFPEEKKCITSSGNKTEPLIQAKSQKQISLNGMIFDFYSDATEAPVQKSPGRPRKDPSQKVKGKTVKLSPNKWEEIKTLPFGRGNGTKIAEMTQRYLDMKDVEKQQCRTIAQLCKKIGLVIKDKSRINEAELKRTCDEINFIKKILKLSKKTYRENLSPEEYKNLEFSEYYQSNLQ